MGVLVGANVRVRVGVMASGRVFVWDGVRLGAEVLVGAWVVEVERGVNPAMLVMVGRFDIPGVPGDLTTVGVLAALGRLHPAMRMIRVAETAS